MDPNYLSAHARLGRAYLQESMYREGIAEFEKMLLISPGEKEAVSDLGYAYALAGRRAEAQKLLDQLKGVSKRKYVPAGSIAQIYVAFGEKDDAFEVGKDV